MWTAPTRRTDKSSSDAHGRPAHEFLRYKLLKMF
uniref:Uncharacterized protein n=1 Tax=Anguilla anguilla TaxID=7936 RepID=A0A0E9XNK7_ANGAN